MKVLWVLQFVTGLRNWGCRESRLHLTFRIVNYRLVLRRPGQLEWAKSFESECNIVLSSLVSQTPPLHSAPTHLCPAIPSGKSNVAASRQGNSVLISYCGNRLFAKLHKVDSGYLWVRCQTKDSKVLDMVLTRAWLASWHRGR